MSCAHKRGVDHIRPAADLVHMQSANIVITNNNTDKAQTGRGLATCLFMLKEIVRKRVHSHIIQCVKVIGGRSYAQSPVTLPVPRAVVHGVVLTASPVGMDHNQCRASGDSEPFWEVLRMWQSDRDVAQPNMVRK